MSLSLIHILSVRSVITAVKSVKYLWHGVRTIAKGKLEVPVLDATAIGVSIFRGDFETAGSTMFLLEIGEILEEWTHKKSVDDLARSMSLHVSRVWLMKDGQEILVPSDQIRTGDEIVAVSYTHLEKLNIWQTVWFRIHWRVPA